jgi:peroxiredoxin Q/BCP
MSKILPAFSLENQNSETVTDENLKGSYTVLYFYPRDNTPGCSTEAIDFTALKPKFEEKNCKIIGVSADTVQKHINFITKKELGIDLLADPELELLEACGVWQQKKLAGREYMGIVRTTLLLNEKNEIVETWDKVKVKEHAAKVLEKLTEIQN